MALLSACRLTNTELLQKKKLVSTLNRGPLSMQKIFLVVENYFTIRLEKNITRKIPVDDIAFELKNFSCMKVLFNNIVSSAEIKATSEVTKNVLVSIIKLYIKVRTHSFA